MNLSFNYYKFYIVNHIRRRYEFIKSKKYRRAYFLLLFIDIFLGPILLFFGSFYLFKAFSEYIYIIDYYYKLFCFFYIGVLSVLGSISEILFPIDKNILFKSPNSCFNIFNKVFISTFLKKSQFFSLIVVVCLSISLNLPHSTYNFLNYLLVILFSIYLSYVLVIVISKLKIKGMKGLINFNYLLFNIISGLSLLFFSYIFITFCISIFVKPLFMILTSNLNHKVNFSWGQLFSKEKHDFIYFHKEISNMIFNYLPHMGLDQLSIFIFWTLLIFIIHITMVVTKNVGFWYRGNFIIFESIKAKNFISKYMKENLIKIQVLNFLGNVEQLTLHKSYIYISYSLWIYTGVLLACNNHLDKTLSSFVTVIIVYMMTRDANTLGVDFFSNSLRFDSERKSIALYRMANIKFEKLYYAKINIIRILALKECVLILLLIQFIFKLDILPIIFCIIIAILNFFIVPHLSLFSSFISPHFQSQHFNELEDLGEDEFLEDKIFNKFNSILTSIYIYSFLLGYFFNISNYLIFLFNIIITCIVFIIFTFLIKKTIDKVSKKWQRRDLYL